MASVKGGAAVIGALDALNAQAGKGLRLAASMGAVTVCRHAKENLRKNGTWETGSLARSVHVGGHQDLTPDFDPIGDAAKYGRHYSTVAAPVETPDRATVYAGTNLEYGEYIEKGTSRRGASPFLQPAGEGHLDEIVKDVAETLKTVWRL